MSEKKGKKPELRSVQWFGRNDIYGFIYRSWTKNRGIPQDQFDGRPVIGICNTWSEATPCNAHFRDLAEQVKRGVWDEGGFPIEFPVMSLGETLMRPTTMLFRNQTSMLCRLPQLRAEVEPQSKRSRRLDAARSVTYSTGYFTSRSASSFTLK